MDALADAIGSPFCLRPARAWCRRGPKQPLPISSPPRQPSGRDGPPRGSPSAAGEQKLSVGALSQPFPLRLMDPCMPTLADGPSGDCASRTRFAAEAAKPCSSRFGATGRPWRLSVVAGREPGFEAGYRQTDAPSRRHVQTRKG